jgi:hypothetical protein
MTLVEKKFTVVVFVSVDRVGVAAEAAEAPMRSAPAATKPAIHRFIVTPFKGMG